MKEPRNMQRPDPSTVEADEKEKKCDGERDGEHVGGGFAEGSSVPGFTGGSRSEEKVAVFSAIRHTMASLAQKIDQRNLDAAASAIIRARLLLESEAVRHRRSQAERLN